MRTKFRHPDVISIGLGGGSIIRSDTVSFICSLFFKALTEFEVSADVLQPHACSTVCICSSFTTHPDIHTCVYVYAHLCIYTCAHTHMCTYTDREVL